jgi:hypothetical protein
MYCDRSRRGGLILTALMALALLVSGGCEELGVMAGKVVGTQEVPAAYAGLQGQRIGVMVWADAGVVIDHPRIFADVANGLQNKLQQARDANVKELTGAKFVRTDLILQYQDAHPEAQSDSAEQVAAKLPLTRLIYVELASFTLHPNDSLDLSKGEAIADVKVVEVAGGKAKMAYENDNISGVYPPNAPPEGLPGLSDDKVYQKTIDALTTEIAKQFMSREADTQ